MGWFIPIAAAVGSKLLGGATSKKEETSGLTKYAQPRYVSPEQGSLLTQMLQRYMSGGGEFGFGGAAKQAQATLGAGLASRGISPTSGVAQSAMGQMLAQALAQDTAARRAYGLNLLQARPQTYTPWVRTSGKTVQPGSLTQGLAQGLDVFGGIALGRQAGWF